MVKLLDWPARSSHFVVIFRGFKCNARPGSEGPLQELPAFAAVEITAIPGAGDFAFSFQSIYGHLRRCQVGK